MQGEVFMQNRKLTCPIMLTEEENWIVATDIYSGVASQGKSIPEAMENLREALELYYEDSQLPSDSDLSNVFLTTMEVCI